MKKLILSAAIVLGSLSIYASNQERRNKLRRLLLLRQNIQK